MSTQKGKSTTQPKQKPAKVAKEPVAEDGLKPEQRIPERDIKQNAGVSASMALQAAQKAWELRQAAHGAGDAKAREQILAKAINKEIEAESFGKAAKYTQSGAFQGLAAGAGLGVQPGVTLGKITGALVGGLVSTVTGLLGGGIGSVYGAMNGPFWDLGEMASQGVQGVIGDWLPDWKCTSSQKKALEKMVMQTKETQAPTEEELEQMKADAPDGMPQSWSQSVKDMTSWRPSMPSMPAMPSVSKGGAALGLGGLGASMPSWGGQKKASTPQTTSESGHGTQAPAQRPEQAVSQRPKPGNSQASKSKSQPVPEEAAPQESPTPSGDSKPAKRSQRESKPPATATPKKPNQDSASEASSQQNPPKPKPSPAKTTRKEASNAGASNPPAKVNSKAPTSTPAKRAASEENKENKESVAVTNSRRKPRKLDRKASSTQPAKAAESAQKKAPRKLESRQQST